MARGKKKRIATVEFIDEAYVGKEPVWDTVRALKMKAPEFDHFMTESFRYYNHFYTNKQLRKNVVKWLTDNKKLTKAQLTAYIKSEDWRTPMTVCSLIMAHNKGMPLKKNAVDYVMGNVMAAVHAVMPPDKPDKPAAQKMTIQDHMKLQLESHLSHFDQIEDKCWKGEDVKPDGYKYLTSKNVPQAMVGKIADVYKKNRAEFEEAKKGKDEQLKEGYSQHKPKDFKRILAFYDALQADLDSYAQTKKVARKARVKKAPSKEKLVSKLNYKKDELKLKLVSINPTEIVGAQSLWVYNVRTRKLGVYVADSTAGTLGIKGSAILGFDESKSVSKTLRKPEIQLAEFQKSGKVALRKFLTDIRATETALKSRINKDTILLKTQ